MWPRTDPDCPSLWFPKAAGLGETLDTSTAAANFAAIMLMAVAQLERRLISERTKPGLVVVRSQGRQFGKPSQVPEEQARAASEALGGVEAPCHRQWVRPLSVMSREAG